ncbi:MAG: hypothetical protein HYY06_13380 [Deltaproteobacteria bacterium]|nr:hypothetical protein [Deltaproteobacteria bacterium]
MTRLRFASLALLASCSCGDDDDSALVDGGEVGRDGGDAGEVEVDAGRDAARPECADDPPPRELAISTVGPFATTSAFVVVTGALPDGAVAVEVDGSARGARFDADRGVFAYLLARQPGEQIDVEVISRDGAGVTTGPVAVEVSVGDAGPLPGRDLDPAEHTVGTWMFTWFTGSGWTCDSPWRPVGGFETWDGSVAWARGQLVDQLDARIDLVGLQLDTIDGEGPTGYRWRNVVAVLTAARELLDEGWAPPRLFPLVDTAILADFYAQATGRTLDLSTEEGREHLYGFARAFHEAAAEELGPRAAAFGEARTQGRPLVALWHSVTIDGEDDAAIRDIKERFAAEFGAEPFLVAHPNDWRLYTEVDEITLMFGPPEHFFSGGRDADGRETLNIEAGFWNPTTNAFYLPRVGGGNYDDAWAQALAARDGSRRLYIDSWNETGEGSGIFEAEPVEYGADDRGPCGTWANLHAESWGPTARHYIDTTRANASTWNDAPDLDAEVVAHDLPETMRAGERRWATVAMRNRGDATWPFSDGPALAARGEDRFSVGAAAPLPDPEADSHAGGIPRGGPALFPVLLTAPCSAGPATLRVGLVDGGGSAFGDELSWAVTVVE